MSWWHIVMKELLKFWYKVGIHDWFSGAHTFGRTQCALFINRLYNFNCTGNPDPTLNKTYSQTLQGKCLQNGDATVVANLDCTHLIMLLTIITYLIFKFKRVYSRAIKNYFQLLGLIRIDIVNSFTADQRAFFASFVVSTIKMIRNISPLTGNVWRN